MAFFERAEILGAPDDDEILPIEYSDNYVTVFPGETVEVHGVVPTDRTSRQLGTRRGIQLATCDGADQDRGEVAVHEVDQNTEQMVRTVLAYAENRLRMDPVPLDKGVLPADELYDRDSTASSATHHASPTKCSACTPR